MGNPGREYQKTRHNIGFRVADQLAGERPRRRKFKAHWSRVRLGGKQGTVIKPQTYMNLSGEAVESWLCFLKL